MANGRVVVPAPAFTPSQYGLLSVARDMTAQFEATPSGAHWAAGIVYQPLCSADSTTFDECLVVTGVGASPEPPVKSATFDSERRGATPFTVISRKDCSAPTFWNDAPAEVNEALTEGEGWQVERAFWTGAAAGVAGVVHPHLAASAPLIVDLDTLELGATTVTGAPVDIVLGLGLIEQALANCYQGAGVIHIPASLGPALAAWGLIKDVGGRYITPSGNLVALGRGYPGTSPAGAETAGVQWIYATGAVFYARSAMRSIGGVEGFNRANNTLAQLAERTYVVGWDCCLLAIPINVIASIPVSNASLPLPTGAATAANQLLMLPTVLFVEIDTAASGSTALVAAAGGANKIRVMSYVMVAEGTVAVEFRSGATGITGPMPLAVNSGVASSSASFGLFETAANTALNINLSAAIGVRGHLSYVITT